jgi:hypothetical protein
VIPPPPRPVVNRPASATLLEMRNRGAPRKFWLVFGLLVLLFQSLQTNGQTFSPSTGIEGTFSISPVHGGPTRAGETDSAPLANVQFDVANDAGLQASFTTDAGGHFRVPLPPGRYSIKMREKKKMGGCGTIMADVPADGFAKVHWDCDTGIR